MMPSVRDTIKSMFSNVREFADDHKPLVDEVFAHLVRFGYLDDVEAGMAGSTGELRDLVNKATKLLCAHTGINASGLDLLVELSRFIRRNPRCSCTEHEHMSMEAATAKWTKKSLTYYVEKVPRNFTKPAFQLAVKDYFKNWEAVCDITFTEKDQSNSDIIVSTGRGAAQQFDGAGGTLAWAYLPNGTDSQLLMRFDDDETFTQDPSGRGIYLEAVATHEFGHLIGLSHAPTAGYLMSPYYDVKVFKPRSWDIDQAVTRYGKPTVITPPVPPAPPAPPSNPYLVDVNTIIVPGFRLVKVS